MWLYDFVSKAFVNNNKIKKEKIRKLLLRNPAALGDVWYTLRLANAIKTKNPDIEIGLLVGSWSEDMVRSCKDITYVHVEDHPIMNRQNIGIWRKLKFWYKTRKCALSEIRAIKYDVAVDCYYFFPSAARLIYQAEIPIRVGYDSREGVAYYNVFKHWKVEDIHNIEYQAELVKLIDLKIDDLKGSTVRFKKIDEKQVVNHYLGDDKYIVISVGTGSSIKEWSKEKWVAMLNRLTDLTSIRIVFVGVGDREKYIIDYILDKVNGNLLSLCNRLSVQQLVAIVKSAVLFIGVDSFIGHIAATYNVPQICIMHGSSNKYHWQPFGNKNSCVIRNEVACSPCYFPSMCKNSNMCMDISVNMVIDKIKQENFL